MYTSTGVLVYNPLGLSEKGKQPQPFWLIVKCSDELIAYYRWFVLKNTGIKLNKPAWGAHISVIRGEEIYQNQDKWGFNEGIEITYQYNSFLNTDGKYWWLDVNCDYLLDIREEFGLNREPLFALHLTIGRLNDS